MPAKKKKSKARKKPPVQSLQAGVRSKGNKPYSFWTVSEECEYYAGLGECIEFVYLIK